MLLEAKKKNSFRRFFQNRGKKFWVPIFSLAVLALGFGAWAILNAMASSGSVTVYKVSNSRTRSDNTQVDTSLIRYGVDPDNSNRTWGTYRYNVVASGGSYTGMCLQPNISGPDNQSFSITVDSSTDALTMKELMLVSIDGLDSTVQNAFNSANPNFWENLAAKVSNLRVITSHPIGYSPYYYTDYYYNATWSGCGTAGSSSDCSDLSKSKVPKSDYVYALGHMMIGSYVNQIGYGLTTTEVNDVEAAARSIEAWFNSNTTYKTRASEYDLYTTIVPDETSVQKIGWLEYRGPSTGKFKICKQSTTGDYLQGAVFTIGSQTYTTGSDGCTGYIEVEPATITYYETTAPTGYIGYSAAQTCTVEAGDAKTCNAHTNQKIATARVKIKKVDSETSACTARGSVSVQGTVFSVKNSSNTEVSTITIGSDCTGTSGTINEGTYTITEKTASTGYKTNGASIQVTIGSGDDGKTLDFTTSSTTCGTNTTSACWFKDDIIKGKVSFTKTGFELATNGDSSSRPLGGISFTAVNKSDSSITYTIGPTAADGSVTSPEMIYGDYTATEIRSAANPAYNLLSFDFSVTSTSTTSIGTKNNTIPDNPSLVTNARNSSSTFENPDKKIEISATASVIDRITCSGLQSGIQYKLEGELYAAGVSSTIKTNSSTFTADASGTCGNIDMAFAGLNTYPHMGKKLNVKQVLYKNNGTTSSPVWVRIYIHNANLTDTKEQVEVKTIEIATVAKSERTINDKQLAAGKVKIKDTYEIIGMANGHNYTFKGYVKDSAGNVVATATDNIPMTLATGAKYTATMTFEFDSTPYVGQNLYVYQELYEAGISTPLVKHNENLNDADESVSVLVPELITNATSAADGSKELNVGTVTVKDTVTYKGLAAGSQYTIRGEVWKLKADGTKDFRVATASDSFTASSEDDTTTGRTLNFTVDAITNCAVNNKLSLPCKFVVFEYIYYGTNNNFFQKHEDTADTAQIVSVKTPTIATTATDAQNDTKELPVGTTTVIDKVTYTNLVPGQTYIVKGKLVDAATGATIKDVNGSDITTSESFPAAGVTGTVTIDSFRKFDSTLDYDFSLGTNQKQYVVYQTLYYGDIELVAHEDRTDADQTVKITVPKLHTDARYKNRYDGNSSKLLGVGDVTMIDYVDYEGLVEGEWYTIVGYIVDPLTGDIVKIDDEYVENSKTFKADTKGKGTVTLEINVNTITIQGRKFVVHEELYRSPRGGQDDDRLLAEHKEQVDEGDQTISVKVAKIETTATDKSDGDNVLPHENGQVIHDVIDYDGLLMDEDYTLYGYLYDKTNDTPLLKDGKRIDAYTTFTTPTRVDHGTIDSDDMDFPVDAHDLPGVEIVVLEYLFQGDQDAVPLGDDGYPDTTQVVAKHDSTEPPASLSQTVRVNMRVGTEAADVYDGDQTIGVGKVQVIDKLKYEGAHVGQTYKAKGWLVYKDSGEKVQGVTFTEAIECPELDEEDESDEESEDACEPVAATKKYVDIEGETTFTIGDEGYEETTGLVPITFEFDSRELINKQLVVFEELYIINDDGSEELVAEHKDLKDSDQTVRVATPEIRTLATDKADGDQELAKSGEVTIVDKVTYAGLAKGTTYILHGELVDKNTGERITADGVTEVTWEFTATADAGVENLEFTIKTDGLNGKAIVVFEELYIESPEADEEKIGDKIAEHKDLNDADQTIWVGPAKPNTGLFTRMFEGAKQSGLIIVIIGITAVSLAAYAIRRTRRYKVNGEISFEQ